MACACLPPVCLYRPQIHCCHAEVQLVSCFRDVKRILYTHDSIIPNPYLTIQFCFVMIPLQCYDLRHCCCVGRVPKMRAKNDNALT